MNIDVFYTHNCPCCGIPLGFGITQNMYEKYPKNKFGWPGVWVCPKCKTYQTESIYGKAKDKSQ